MITEAVRVEGFEIVEVRHNEDWSGDAVITWLLDGAHRQVTVPAAIIQGILEYALKEIADGIIAAFNQHSNTVIPEPSYPPTPPPLPTLNDVLTTFKAK